MKQVMKTKYIYIEKKFFLKGNIVILFSINIICEGRLQTLQTL